MNKADQKLWKDTLINMEIVTEKQIDLALEEQKETGDKLRNILVRRGYISRRSLSQGLASSFGLVPVKIDNYEPPKDVINSVPASIARRHKLLPLEIKDNKLKVALSDPLDFLALDNLEQMTSRTIEPVLTSERDVDSRLTQFYGVEDETIDTVITEISEESISFAGSAESAALEEEMGVSEEAPIIRLVSMLVLEAYKARASDIHIEPLAGRVRIRYRVDGILHEVQAPPKKLQGSILSRIKILAGMNIAEKRLPQDGRILVNILGKSLDLRVSSLPALHGESMVMRLLDRSTSVMDLGELGFLEEDRKRWEEVISLSNGIILVTGPTGSGKTTSLYAVLNELNTPDVKILTVEEPVEYHMSGINQIQIQPQIDLTFSNCLRSLLRQAPDIIMVGEIRDPETAEIAIRAALTGHLVFSTLHTNDAATGVTRLVDMGIKPFLASSSIQAIMAQRLVRKVCPDCKEPYQPPETVLKQIKREVGHELKETNFIKGRGCKECSNTGYKGRIAMFELLVMSPKIRNMVIRGATSHQLRDSAREEGMKLLREDGWIKASRGITTVEEVVRVTQTDVEEGKAG